MRLTYLQANVHKLTRWRADQYKCAVSFTMPSSVDRLAGSAGHKRRCAEFVFGWIYSNTVQVPGGVSPLIYVVDCCSSEYTIVDTLAVKALRAHLPSYSTPKLARICCRTMHHPTSGSFDIFVRQGMVPVQSVSLFEDRASIAA
ncbi:hypothetical protein J6590_096040 [Homalodisca vitripennis]|nr:hypothetical protein J6590_096040 [Homalodisca vitripennis]